MRRALTFLFVHVVAVGTMAVTTTARRRPQPPRTSSKGSERTRCSGSTRPCSRTPPCCLAMKERITCTRRPPNVACSRRRRAPFPWRKNPPPPASRRGTRTTVSVLSRPSRSSRCRRRPGVSPSMSRRSSRNRGTMSRRSRHRRRMFPFKVKKNLLDARSLSASYSDLYSFQLGHI